MWATARRLSRSERALARLDVGCLFAQTAAYGAIAPLAPSSSDQLGPLYTGAARVSAHGPARAIIVPSTASRTLVASAAAFVPVLVCVAIASWYARHDVVTCGS